MLQPSVEGLLQPEELGEHCCRRLERAAAVKGLDSVAEARSSLFHGRSSSVHSSGAAGQHLKPWLET